MRWQRLCFGGVSLIIIFASLNIGTASAHELETDNNVSVVMHIPPSDSPEANQTTLLNFYFGNTSGTFQLKDYNIYVNVEQDGTSVQKSLIVPAFGGATADGATTVVFPKVGAYKVELIGTNEEEAELNFIVNYSVNVTASATTGSEPTTKNKSGSVVLFGATALVALIMLACQQIIDGGRYKSKRYRP